MHESALARGTVRQLHVPQRRLGVQVHSALGRAARLELGAQQALGERLALRHLVLGLARVGVGPEGEHEYVRAELEVPPCPLFHVVEHHRVRMQQQHHRTRGTAATASALRRARPHAVHRPLVVSRQSHLRAAQSPKQSRPLRPVVPLLLPGDRIVERTAQQAPLAAYQEADADGDGQRDQEH